MEDVYTFVKDFFIQIRNSGYLARARAASEESRFENYTREAVWTALQQDPLFMQQYLAARQQVFSRQSYAYKAAGEVMKNLRLTGDQ